MPGWAFWRRAGLYGAAVGGAATALAWLDYRRLVLAHVDTAYLLLVATGFLALGVYAGVRLSRREGPSHPGNPAALQALGVSPRELDVLRELAAGRSNKEIARRLEVSPNTVKTHVARLYAKLGAVRRTDAVNRARELGIVP